MAWHVWSERIISHPVADCSGCGVEVCSERSICGVLALRDGEEGGVETATEGREVCVGLDFAQGGN